MEEFAGYTAAMTAALLAMGNVLFLMFDQVLARISALYQNRGK